VLLQNNIITFIKMLHVSATSVHHQAYKTREQYYVFITKYLCETLLSLY